MNVEEETRKITAHSYILESLMKEKEHIYVIFQFFICVRRENISTAVMLQPVSHSLCVSLTFTNILPTEERALLGVQYTDMDFLSLENSKVNSFFISCLIT